MQIETALLAAVASFVGAWLAARLALARFSREKVWERKAAAYTAIFEALHFIGRWYEKNFEASIIQEELSDERTMKLKSEANQAEDDLERRLGSETWLIPVHCRARLEKMTVDLKNSQHKETTWQGFLDAGGFIVSQATTELRLMVIEDLKLDQKWYNCLL